MISCVKHWKGPGDSGVSAHVGLVNIDMWWELGMDINIIPHISSTWQCDLWNW